MTNRPALVLLACITAAGCEDSPDPLEATSPQTGVRLFGSGRFFCAQHQGALSGWLVTAP